MFQTSLRRPSCRKQLRLFFAIYPPRQIRRQLADIQTGFDASTAKPVAADNLHLTLAFLGEVPADRYACYAQSAGTLPPPNFTLTLDRFHYFGKVALLWFASSAPPQELLALQRELATAISSCGYRSQRSFKPHITLFRKASKLRCPDLTPSLAIHVDRFFLVESILDSHGANYRLLEQYSTDRGSSPV